MSLKKRHIGPDGKPIPRKDRTGASPVKVGLLVLAVAAIGTYFGFTKDLPFSRDFRFNAVFQQANSIRPGSPVRIAGVNVGKVVEVGRYRDTNTAVVTMELKEKGLPIHRDATLKIRPRIFLEGNFFVDLRPGTPSAPKLSDGDTVPVTRTATPVQLDQVLTALQSDTRQDLQDALEGYGKALTHRPTELEDRDQDPDVQGESAAESLNDSLTYGGDALQGSAIVNEALLGRDRRDLSKLIAGLNRVSGALASREQQLKELISGLNTTTAAFASQQSAVGESIRVLPNTLQQAQRAFATLNDAFPATRAFAREVLPGVRQTPATIAAARPWLEQAGAWFAPSELGGLAQEVRAASPNIAALTDGSIDTLKQTTLVSRCARDVLLPTGDVEIKDEFASGLPNYKEFWHAISGLSGEGAEFDGNGSYVRLHAGGGPYLTRTPKLPGRDARQNRLVAHTALPPRGYRPKKPSQNPPKRSDLDCYKNTPPNLNGPAAKLGPADEIVTYKP